MKPQSIKIDEVEYVRADSVPPKEGDIKIVVLDKGFVYVGNVKFPLSPTDNFLLITGARNIRYWGTTKGLGELVKGPLLNTKLDLVGTVRVPFHALIHLIDVEQAKWSSI